MPSKHVTRRTVLHALPLPLLAAAIGCSGPGGPKADVVDPWGEAANIRKRIKAPTIRDQIFNITAFGAAAVTGVNNGPAIRDAIEAASNAGGGVVVVPSGIFATGPVHLKSGVELHLEDGAQLFFIPNPELYLPPVFTRWEGVEFMGYSPLIYAFEQSDIAITGKGIIDGGASNVHWWPWKGPWKGKFADAPDTQGTARQRLFADAEAGIAPENRVYANGAFIRPPLIQFYRSDRVLIEGVTVRNSPFWCMNPVLCRNVTVRNVTAESHGPNSDGCNPESCEDVLIEGCEFNTGDDCIAIKSGRNADGRRLATPSRNIVISNCRMQDGHGGVVMGSELSGGIENVFVENCQMDSPNLDRGVRIKTNAQRGGFVRNINVRNVDIGYVSELLVVNFFYEEGENGDHKPDVSGIVLENISCREVDRVMNVQGFDSTPVGEISLRGVRVGAAANSSLARNFKKIEMVDVQVAGATITSVSQLTAL